MNKITSHIITLVVVLFGLSQANAQDTLIVKPGQMDSLRNLIKISREDTNKIHLLNEYGKFCFYELDFLNGLMAAKEARELSNKMRYAKGDLLY